MFGYAIVRSGVLVLCVYPSRFGSGPKGTKPNHSTYTDLSSGI